MHLPYIIIALRPSNHKCCIYVSMLTERERERERESVCVYALVTCSLVPQMYKVAFEILIRILQVPLSNLVPDANKCCDSTSNRPRPVPSTFYRITSVVSPGEMWWHTVTHGRGSEGGNWRMEWVASTLRTSSEHGVSSITTADTHTSAASSRLNWRPCWFKWIRTFRRKTKSGFCACAITFQTQSTT